MQRKRFLLALGAAICCLAVGCSGSDGTQENTAEESATNSITVESTETLEISESDSEGIIEESEEEDDNGIGYDVEEQVLIDSEGIKITATGLSLNEYWGYLELNLTVENQTDTDIHVSTSGAQLGLYGGTGSYSYLNGVQVSANTYIDVPTQGASEGNCTFYWNSLKEAGIEDIGEIEVAFHIYDPEFNDILTGEAARCTIQTTLDGDPDIEPSSDMPLLLETEGWQIYGKYVPAVEETEEDKGYILALCRNNTDSSALLRFSDFTVDSASLTSSLSSAVGFMSGFYYENPGHAVLCRISLSEAGNFPEITESSVITAGLETGGSQDGDYTGLQSQGVVAFTIAQ